MHVSNYEPRRTWSHAVAARPAAWLDDFEDDYLCLSCGSFSGNEAFCRRCRDRSRQSMLSEWDDLGTGD